MDDGRKRGNLLGRNLEFVLRSLENCGDSLHDVLLLFHDEAIAFTGDEGFRCVSIPLEMVPGSTFVSIEGHDAGSTQW
jgi:hypothetical protein